MVNTEKNLRQNLFPQDVMIVMKSKHLFRKIVFAMATSDYNFVSFIVPVAPYRENGYWETYLLLKKLWPSHTEELNVGCRMSEIFLLPHYPTA